MERRNRLIHENQAGGVNIIRGPGISDPLTGSHLQRTAPQANRFQKMEHALHPPFMYRRRLLQIQTEPSFGAVGEEGGGDLPP